MRLAYFRGNVLYESKLVLVKDTEKYFKGISDIRLEDYKGVAVPENNTRIFRNTTNILKTTDQVINELKNITNSDIINFNKLLNLLMSKDEINNEKLREILYDFIMLYNYEDTKICTKYDLGQLLRMSIYNHSLTDDISKLADTAYPNTYFLQQLGFCGLTDELTYTKKSSKM